RRFAGRSHEVTAFALTADGKLLATAEQNAITLWDTESGKEIRHLQGDFGGVVHLILSPEGRYVTCDGNKTVERMHGTLLWEVSSGRRLWRMGGPDEDKSSLSPIAFSPDGKMLITHEAKGALVVRDSATGRALRTLTSTAWSEPVAVAAKVPRVAAVDARDRSIHVWELPAGS